jgi:serine/threonine protein kinase
MIVAYPTLEEYNEAFQNPQVALIDPVLKKGTIATTGLGMPLALCGGFALTYTISASSLKYAVRCFHKQSSELEKRYKFIASRIKSLNSPYFLDFEFQPQGIKVKGSLYPLVKMAWAKGGTLGEFLDQNYKSPNQLKQVQNSLRDLAKFLEINNIAHGDISPDNVMVSDNGRSIQLIDYDGMYVDELKTFGSSELGNRNFQHIKRTSAIFNKTLDRFSFILLDIAIEVLISNPSAWNTTQSDANAIIFRANDFSDPESSKIFNEFFSSPQISEKVKNFAIVCKTSFDNIPSLSDFIVNKNIPQLAIAFNKTKTSIVQYLSAYQVLNAQQYSTCLKYVGDKVELIGQIYEVKQDKTRYGKPYVFINFGNWQGNIVKISIWSEGLAVLQNKPDQSWKGKWVSITGLLEPPYKGKGYSHIAISITKNNQLQVISDSEAKYRLSGSSLRTVSQTSQVSNKDILNGIKGTTSITNSAIVNPVPASTVTKPTNQMILEEIKNEQLNSMSNNSSQYTKSSTINNRTSNSTSNNTSSSNCFIATAIYGIHAPETNLLRTWRDQKLLKSNMGRLFVFAYYKISPSLIPWIEKNPWLKNMIKNQLNKLLEFIKNKKI